MTDIKKLGIKGEKFTVKFLKKNKYRILLRNMTCPYGEIDIIACNKKYIVFVEVKTRSEGQMLAPQFSVDYKKRKRIKNTANYFLRKYKTNLQPRYDIAEVTVDLKGKMRINYIKNAFDGEEDLYKT